VGKAQKVEGKMKEWTGKFDKRLRVDRKVLGKASGEQYTEDRQTLLKPTSQK
jgi:hypothetical protein